LTAPSLYLAFGNKDQLFQEAVEYYVQKYGAPVLAPLQATGSAREAIGRMLQNSAALVSSKNNPQGCMVSFAAVNCADHLSPAAALLQHFRGTTFAALQKRLALACDQGELPPTTDTARLARFYQAAMGGIQLLSLDGAAPEELAAVAQDAMRAWPAASPAA
ncbi:MAG TPA: TetR/AcrR family transcriptional regulator, partial [Verrucomicrobiae bacterium]